VRSTETPSDPVQQLRGSTIREAGTGRVLEKPPAPAMRVVEKGGWTYREVRQATSRPEQRDGRREPMG
jgi:hypothetical protein